MSYIMTRELVSVVHCKNISQYHNARLIYLLSYLFTSLKTHRAFSSIYLYSSYMISRCNINFRIFEPLLAVTFLNTHSCWPSCLTYIIIYDFPFLLSLMWHLKRSPNCNKNLWNSLSILNLSNFMGLVSCSFVQDIFFEDLAKRLGMVISFLSTNFWFPAFLCKERPR